VREKPVRFEAAGVPFGGTLTLPEGRGPHPAALLISGGNPVDRDCDVEGFRFFRLIAEDLGRAGVATLRCDDRGVGESGGGSFYDSVLDDHERDVLGAIESLRSFPEIDEARIGLIGHSWGGAVASRVAASTPGRVAFMVTLGTPGESGDTVMLRVRDAMSAGLGDEERERGRLLQIRLHRAARSGEGFDELEAEAGSSEDRFMLQVARTPFFRGLLEHDWLSDLERITCPVLLFFGGADGFVPEEPNRRLMTEALERGGHSDFEVAVVPGAEHFFRDPEISPREFAPGFSRRLGSWIQARARAAQS
jgi:pimeloyl-ACP methyl ester carboxylesterase